MASALDNFDPSTVDLVNVYTTDENGNKTYVAKGVKYTGSDANGAVRDSIKNNKPLYQMDDGRFTTQPIAVTKVSLDTNKDSKTYGNVQMSATKDYLNSQYYKENIKPQLAQLSQMYKVGGEDYKFTDPTDESKQISVKDYIARLNDESQGIVGLAAQWDKVVKGKEEIKNRYGIELSDVQFLKSQQNGVGGKDDSLIYLPSDGKILNYFKNAESFDLASRTISRKDFREIWNRIKSSDEDLASIEELNNSLRETLAQGAADKEWLEKSGISKEQLGDMLAGSLALSGAMSESPEVGFWEGCADIFNNIFVQTPMKIASEAYKSADAVVDTIGSWFGRDMNNDDALEIFAKVKNDVDTELQDFIKTSSVLNPNATAIGSFTSDAAILAGKMYVSIKIGNLAGKLVANGLVKIANVVADKAVTKAATVTAENMAQADRIAAVASKYAPEAAAGIDSVVVPANAMADAGAVETAASAMNAADTVSDIANVTRATEELSEGATSGLKAVSTITGNYALSGTASAAQTSADIIKSTKWAADLINGSNILLRSVAGSPQFATTINGIANTAKAIAGSKAFMTTAELLEQVFVEGMIDAIVFDPDLAKQYFANPFASEEGKAYVREQMLQNALGFGVMTVIGKGVIKFTTDTSLGMELKAEITRSFNKKRAFLSDLGVKLNTAIHRGRDTTERLQETITQTQKAFAAAAEGSPEKTRIGKKLHKLMEQNAQMWQTKDIRAAVRGLADYKGPFTEVNASGKTVYTQEWLQAKIAYADAQNMIDRDAMYYYNQLRNDPRNHAVSSTLRDVETSGDDIRALERQAGLKSAGDIVDDSSDLKGTGNKQGDTYLQQLKENYKNALDNNNGSMVKYSKEVNNYMAATGDLKLQQDGILATPGKTMKDWEKALKEARAYNVALASVKDGGSMTDEAIDLFKATTGRTIKDVESDTIIRRIADDLSKQHALENAVHDKEMLQRLTDAIDKNLVARRMFEYEWNNYKMKNGLQSRSQIMGYRASGKFGKDGEDYIHFMRESDYNKFLDKKAGGNVGSLNLREIDPNVVYARTFSNEDFADMDMVMYSEIFDNMSLLSKNRMVTHIGVNTGAFSKSNILMGGEKSAIAVQADKSIDEAERALSKLYEPTGGSISGKGKKTYTGVIDIAKEDINNEIDKISTALVRENADTYARTQTETLKKAEGGLKKAKAQLKAEKTSARVAAIQAADDDVLNGLLDPKVSDSIKKLGYNGSLGDLTPEQQMDVLDDYFANRYLTKSGDYRKRYEYIQSQIDSINDAYDNGEIALEDGLTRVKGMLAVDDDTIVQSDAVKKIAQMDIEAAEDAAKATYLGEANKAFSDALPVSANAEAIAESVDNIADAVVDKLLEKPHVKALADIYGNNSDAITEYIVLQQTLKGNRKEKFISQVKTELKKTLKKDVGEYLEKNAAKAGTKIDNSLNIKKTLDAFGDRLDARLTAMLDSKRDMAIAAGYEKASEDAFEEIKEIYRQFNDFNRETNAAISGTDVARVLNDNGEYVFYRVSPSFATVINQRIQPDARMKYDVLMRAAARLYRFGQTNLSPKSFMNQNVKDNINALVSGNSFMSYATSIGYIRSNFGDQVNDFLEANAEAFFKDVASKEGTDVVDALVRSGAENVSGASEYEAYRFYSNSKKAKLEAVGLAAKDDKLDEFAKRSEKLQEIVDAPNAARETILRKKVYASGFSDAMKAGFSVDQAMSMGEFMARNATTNFGRAMYHWKNLTNNVPYLRSAFNSQRSFWRLASLDPAGTLGRMMTMVAVPMMAVTVNNLVSKENREIYKNIPEYQRNSAFNFVANGQVYTVPLPEELQVLVAPWRHVVELAYDGNKAAFWQLAVNDAVGIYPVDLTGFVNVDNISLNDPNFWNDHIEPGVTRVLAGVMTPLQKSAFMFFTGKDPYTNAYIDKSRLAYDPNSGETVIMDYTSGTLAKILANISGGFLNAPIMSRIFSSLLGTAGMEVIDGLLDVVNWGVQSLGGDSLTGKYTNPYEQGSFLESSVKSLVDPFTYDPYDRLESAWNSAVKNLWAEKEAKLGSKEYKLLEENISKATSEEARTKAINARNDYLKDYYQHVLSTAKNLIAKDGNFTNAKMWSVISLMNISDYEGGISGDSALSRSSSYDMKQEGIAQATESMIKMGFPTATDTALGSLYKNANGEVEVSWNSPLAVLNYEKTRNIQGDKDTAYIAELSRNNKLKDKTSAAYNQINALNYKTESAKRDAIAVAHNGDVMAAYADYFANHSPEEILSHTDVINEIKRYIIVPDGYKVNNKGKSTSSLGDNGSKADAYIESYIKRMYKMNDTASYDPLNPGTDYKNQDYSKEQ